MLKCNQRFRQKRPTYLSRANIIKAQAPDSPLPRSFFEFANETKINGFYYLRNTTPLSTWWESQMHLILLLFCLKNYKLITIFVVQDHSGFRFLWCYSFWLVLWFICWRRIFSRIQRLSHDRIQSNWHQFLIPQSQFVPLIRFRPEKFAISLMNCRFKCCVKQLEFVFFLVLC